MNQPINNLFSNQMNQPAENLSSNQMNQPLNNHFANPTLQQIPDIGMNNSNRQNMFRNNQSNGNNPFTQGFNQNTNQSNGQNQPPNVNHVNQQSHADFFTNTNAPVDQY